MSFDTEGSRMLLEHFLRISSDDCKQISEYLIGLCAGMCVVKGCDSG